MKFDKEEDLARVIVSSYESNEYQVYKEVCSYGGGSARLDILCVKGNESIAIETKLNVGLKVIEQAYGWLGCANKVYFAIPYKKKNDLYFAKEVCLNFGIGIMLVQPWDGKIVEWLTASVCEEPVLPKLYEEQKDSVAGNAHGDFITPFRITRMKLVEFVRSNPGCTLSDAIRGIKHHYEHESSAKSNIRKLIMTGVISELKIEKLGNNTKLLLSDEILKQGDDPVKQELPGKVVAEDADTHE